MIGKTMTISLIITIGALVAPAAAQPLPPTDPAIQNVSSLRTPPSGLGDEPSMSIPVVEPVSHGIPSDPAKRCPQFEAAFRRYGLKPVATFSYIAWRESRCRIKAINGRWNKKGKLVWTLNANKSVDRGIFQVNSSWRTVTRQVCGGGLDRLLELDCNLKVARYLLQNGGLHHWDLG